MGCQKLSQLQVLLAILASALIISQVSCVKIGTLYTICSQTQNAEICVRILESDPRTPAASLPKLSLISINLTHERASKNYRVFDKLRLNTTDNALKGSYKNCVKIYKAMMHKLVDAYNLAKRRRYNTIHQLGEARDAAFSCENSLPMESTTAAISEDMILTCETSASVNLYLGTYLPPS